METYTSPQQSRRLERHALKTRADSSPKHFKVRFDDRLEAEEFRPYAAQLRDLEAEVRNAVLPRVATQETALDEARRQAAFDEARFTRFRRAARTGAHVAAIMCLVPGLAAGIDAVFPNSRIVNLKDFAWLMDSSTKDGALAVVLILAAAGVVLVTATLINNSPRKRTSQRSVTTELKCAATFRQQLDHEIDAELRRRATQFATLQGILKLPHSAPGLVEVDGLEILDTDTIERVRKLVGRSKTSSTALSGPRGIGKSSTIRALMGDTKIFDLAVVIPAPVKYDPDSLIRRIHRDLAMEVLRKERAGDALTRLQESSRAGVARRRRNMGAVTFVTGVVLVVLNMASGWVGNLTLEAPGVLGLVMVLFAVVTLANGLDSNRRSDTNERVANAVEALHELNYSVEDTSQIRTGVGIESRFLNSEDSSSQTRTRTGRARVELIAELRDFIARDAALRVDQDGGSGSPIGIAIDELDKLPKAVDLVNTINALKDLFRFEGTHFVVSVSTEALENFKLRSVGRRDTFDSSFDEVLEVQPPDLAQTTGIVQSRAIGFPEPLIGLCYSLAGGLPRETIRIARRIVELGSERTQARLEEVAVEVVLEEVTDTFGHLLQADGEMLPDDAVAMEDVLLDLRYGPPICSIDALQGALAAAAHRLEQFDGLVMGSVRHRVEVSRLSIGLLPDAGEAGSVRRRRWEDAVCDVAKLSAMERCSIRERDLVLERTSAVAAELKGVRAVR